MSDSPSHLAREAKGLHQGLKELLKTHNPWDKEVDFNRKNLRRQYLRLLLVEPYAKESKDAETHLWMQTSYQFISHYKQGLATLDRTLQSAPRHQPRQGGHGPVEYRKLMQRFRQFLAEEEKFWTQFIVRYQRSFALHEAYPILVALNILTPLDDVSIPDLPHSGDTNGASNQNHGRNQFSFPSEDTTPVLDPTEHESRLAILSKAVVCLGDITRYRELYNEGGGRPKAGHEDGSTPAKRGGRTRRGGLPGFDSIPRARNYDKAIQCYEQARLLVPYEGNPSHQLAILAFYQSDMFSSLFHYYRALCVRQPYDTASENVKKILNKALDQQSKKIKGNAQAPPDSGELPPRLRVEYFKESVVLLHALWRLGSDKVKMNPVVHAADVAKDFMGLVSERILPIETVSKVVVLSEGALWKHHMIRDNSPPSNRRSGGFPDPTVVGSQILAHVIAIHRVLLEIGAGELAVPPEDAAENDLAQRITAPFRRTLPALRIASKWLSANINYVLHAAQPSDAENQGSARKGSQGILIEELPLFWAKFAQFYSALSRIFPWDRLPPLTTPLDEDVDLRGFLPLRDLLVDGGIVTGERFGEGAEGKRDETLPQGREKVHPNEEQLMRIWDLLKDARGLAYLESCPIYVQGNSFTFDHSISNISSVQINGPVSQVADQTLPYTPGDRVLEHVIEQEEDAMTDTGRTDNDDPVGDAFRTALDDHGALEDDEDAEIILWNPRALGSPPATASTALPATPIVSGVMTKTIEPPPITRVPSVITSRAAPRSPGIVPGTTAQDLLNNVMGSTWNTTDAARPPRPQTSSAIQPQFPFGLGPNAPPSIWSTSLDQKPPLSPPTAMQSSANMSQTLSSQHSWSPPHESTRVARQSTIHPLPHFQSPQSFSAISSGHPRAPQHLHQAPYQSSYGPSGSSGHGFTQPAERRQTHWPSSSNGSTFVDPAIVSAAATSQPTTHYGSPHQAYPNGGTQGYVRPGQHHAGPSTSRIWGIDG